MPTDVHDTPIAPMESSSGAPHHIDTCLDCSRVVPVCGDEEVVGVSQYGSNGSDSSEDDTVGPNGNPRDPDELPPLDELLAVDVLSLFCC